MPLNESLDGTVSLHSWYKDITDGIFIGEMRETRNSSSEHDKANQVAEIAEEICGSVDLAERLKKYYLDDIAVIANSNQENPAMKTLRNQVSKFMEHLGGLVNLRDLADAMMLCAMIRLIERNLRRSSEGGYGINVLKERLIYSSLDPAVVPFYHTLVGFIVNGFINEEIISVGKWQKSRPFYSISILLLSRVLGGPFAEAVSKEFLEGSSVRLDLSHLYSSKSRASYVPRRFIAAISAILEGLDYFQVVSDFEKAQLLYCKGLLREALEEFDKAISSNPKNPDYHSRKGGVLHDLGKFPEALEEFNQAIALEPDNPTYHSNKAGALLRMGKFSRALEEFDKAIALDRNNPVYHSNKGGALDGMGKFPEALEEFNQAIALKPDNPVYHDKRGNVLLRMEKLPEALEEFDKAISLNPDNSDYHNNRNNVLRSLEKVSGSLAPINRG